MYNYYAGDLLISKFDHVPLVDSNYESVEVISKNSVVTLVESNAFLKDYLKIMTPSGIIAWVFKGNVTRIVSKAS